MIKKQESYVIWTLKIKSKTKFVLGNEMLSYVSSIFINAIEKLSNCFSRTL